MDASEEIELIETTISYLESAINELKENPYFRYKIASLEDDIYELKERLHELEEIQEREWSRETRDLEHEYWQDQF